MIFLLAKSIARNTFLEFPLPEMPINKSPETKKFFKTAQEALDSENDAKEEEKKN